MVLHNFIVFEGIDGAGTSTQLERLRARADSERFWFTAEPTDAPTGRFLRSMLRGDITLDPRTAAYLFAADRVEHVWGHGGASADAGNGFVSTRAADGGSASADAAEAQSGAVSTHAADGNIGAASISAQCAHGKLVVSDRYFFSSLAYQSIDCGMELPAALNSIFPLPALLFFFDIAPEAALARVDSRGAREIYEKADFLAQVRAAYKAVFARYADSGMRIVTLDAAESADAVEARIAAEIKQLYDV